MEQKNLGYSMKNIPIPSKKEYLKRLIEKIESLIRRMRWKAYFFENPGENASSDESDTGKYGLKSKQAPPPNERLNQFEDDLYEMVRSIQFRPVGNSFLNKLKSDAMEINKSEKLLIFADKTTNLYSVSKDNYEKLLTDNITKNYKKASSNIESDLNKEASSIARSLNLEKRMECIANRKAFVSLKDHKDNFNTNPKCRLINPAKSEIGLISKIILQNINKALRKIKKLNQWGNTASVISWFNNICNKQECKFMKFDIVDFYPSISENLLNKSLEFAKKSVSFKFGHQNNLTCQKIGAIRQKLNLVQKRR